MQIAHIRTSPYQPSSNSNAELVNRDLIRHIRIFCADKTDFPRHLPAIASAINTSINSTTKVTPYYCCFGKQFKSPLDSAMTDTITPSLRDNCPKGLEQIADNLQILREIVQETAMAVKTKVAESRNKKANAPIFAVGDRVYIAAKLAKRKLNNRKHFFPFCGPYVVTAKPQTYLAKLIHFSTQRPIKRYINTAHLISASDVRRENREAESSPQAATLVSVDASVAPT